MTATWNRPGLLSWAAQPDSDVAVVICIEPPTIAAIAAGGATGAAGFAASAGLGASAGLAGTAVGAGAAAGPQAAASGTARAQPAAITTRLRNARRSTLLGIADDLLPAGERAGRFARRFPYVSAFSTRLLSTNLGSPPANWYCR